MATRRVTRKAAPVEGKNLGPKVLDKDPETREEAEAFIATMQPVMAHETIVTSMDRVRKLANSMLIIAKDNLKPKP